MIKIKTVFLCCCILYGTTDIYAQTGSIASGGEATGAGGLVSYSIGQVNFITVNGSGVITQGLEQPYEITTVTSIKITGINLSACVYPNPTTDYVILSIGDAKNQNMNYSLFDMQGKHIAGEKIIGNQTTISLRDLPCSIYFIKVLNENQEVKIFKINKTL